MVAWYGPMWGGGIDRNMLSFKFRRATTGQDAGPPPKEACQSTKERRRGTRGATTPKRENPQVGKWILRLVAATATSAAAALGAPRGCGRADEGGFPALPSVWVCGGSLRSDAASGQLAPRMSATASRRHLHLPCFQPRRRIRPKQQSSSPTERPFPWQGLVRARSPQRALDGQPQELSPRRANLAHRWEVGGTVGTPCPSARALAPAKSQRQSSCPDTHTHTPQPPELSPHRPPGAPGQAGRLQIPSPALTGEALVKLGTVSTALGEFLRLISTAGSGELKAPTTLQKGITKGLSRHTSKLEANDPLTSRAASRLVLATSTGLES